MNTQTKTQTTAADLARATYTEALAKFKRTLEEAKSGIAQGDAARASIKTAENTASWAGFDLVALMAQPERRDAAYAIGKQIASQREGVKEENARKYAGRMANACTLYVESLTAFDDDKRAKADPMSAVVAIERANAKAAKKTEAETARQAHIAQHGEEAYNMAANTYQPPMSALAFAALVGSGNPDANERYNHALEILAQRAAFAKNYPTWQERNALRATLAATEAEDAKAFAEFKKATTEKTEAELKASAAMQSTLEGIAGK